MIVSGYTTIRSWVEWDFLEEFGAGLSAFIHLQYILIPE